MNFFYLLIILLFYYIFIYFGGGGGGGRQTFYWKREIEMPWENQVSKWQQDTTSLSCLRENITIHCDATWQQGVTDLN